MLMSRGLLVYSMILVWNCSSSMMSWRPSCFSLASRKAAWIFSRARICLGVARSTERRTARVSMAMRTSMKS